MLEYWITPKVFKVFWGQLTTVNSMSRTYTIIRSYAAASEFYFSNFDNFDVPRIEGSNAETEKEIAVG